MKTLWERQERPLVTGAILVYNKLDFVQDCILSAIQCSGLDKQDFDLRLWDQGSPYPGVQEYLAGLRELDWPKVEGCGFNIGVGGALNQVIENSDSEFFFKLDDDCVLLPQTLPILVIAYSLARSYGFPLAVLSADVMGVGKAETSYEVEVAPGFCLQCAPCVGGGAVLIGRDVLNDVGPFRADRLYGVEDGDFAFRATQKGYYNAYLKGAFHVSRCRTPEADANIDKWKLEYFCGKTDLPFDEWSNEWMDSGKENLADFY